MAAPVPTTAIRQAVDIGHWARSAAGTMTSIMPTADAGSSYHFLNRTNFNQLIIAAMSLKMKCRMRGIPRIITGSHWTSIQGVIMLLVVAYFGKPLFVPMSYGLLIAVILYPVCKKFEQRRWPRSLAVGLSLGIVILLFLTLLGLLIFQLNMFSKDLPELAGKLGVVLTDLRHWIATRLHLTTDQQDNWWRQWATGAQNSLIRIIGNSVGATTNVLISLLLVPVYAALFLYNRGTFLAFLQKIAGEQYKAQLPVLLNEVIHTYYGFIKGMIKVYIIVGILNSIGLLALGIPHAILFGMVTAIMTIIPYVGIIVSALIPISVAWLTKDSVWYPLGVVAVFSFVQYLEANLIFPKVVAAQLNVSTWATLVAIVAGGLLWGISGMILFIPFVAILKLIVSRVKEGEALNILLSR